MTDRQQTEEKVEQQAFLKGFEDENAATGRASQPEPVKSDSQQVSTEAASKIESKASEAKPQPKKPERKPQDEYVRLTKADYESLKTNAGKVPELEKRIETAFGKFGPTQQTINEMKRTIEAVTAATPRGQAVELPADVVSELEAEYPDLAGGVRSALTKALKGLIGTGKTEAVSEDVIKSRFEDFALRRAAEDLEEAHPNWKEIVGAVADPSQVNQAHPFRTWLAKQPKEYQDKINNARNPSVIGNAIRKFQASQAATPAVSKTKPVIKQKPSQKVQFRKNRIQGSVQPKGLGAPPQAQRESVDDAFASGFKAG